MFRPVHQEFLDELVGFLDNDPNVICALPLLDQTYDEEKEVLMVCAYEAKKIWNYTLNPKLISCIFMKDTVSRFDPKFLTELNLDDDVKVLAEEVGQAAEIFSEDIDQDMAPKLSQGAKDVWQLYCACAIQTTFMMHEEEYEPNWFRVQMLHSFMLSMGYNPNAGLTNSINKADGEAIEMMTNRGKVYKYPLEIEPD